MNLITSPLITDRSLADYFQDKYLDTGALISLSSTSRGVHAVYREALMRRMVALFNLAVVVPVNSSFNAAVMTALRQKIVDETNAIAQEMADQTRYILEEMNRCDLTPIPRVNEGNTLACRADLFSKIRSLLPNREIPIRACLKHILTPASLHFLLSCARR